MVTLDAALGGDQVCRALVREGMDIARINAAHGDPAGWRSIAENVRTAAAAAAADASSPSI